MAYDIGTARGVIEMDYNGRGIDQAQDDLTAVEQKGGGASRALEGAGKASTRAGLAIAAGLGAAVFSAANFEQRISAIGAVSGATEADLDKVRKKALQLGKDTQFSASESASAMEELIKAGLSVDEVLNGAADATVALAAAGSVDMPTAATISSNAMNQFGLVAKDMVGVVDSIAGAANASAIDVGQFGQSLQQVGAVANLAGVTFDDTATAIALLGNAGIVGSDAGTSLKTMFQRLQPVTDKQMATFKELGLITKDGNNQFYDAQGNLKDLASVSGILQNALKDQNAQQKQATLATLFGSDAIRAAAVLTREGAAGFREMSGEMGKVTAADVAAKRMDNFKGSLEEMLGSLETLGITIGTALLPPLRELVDAITNALNWFLNLSDGMQKFISFGALGAAAVLLIIGQLIKLVLWGKRVQFMLAGTRIAFLGTWAAALGPIAAVIAAIALIGLGLVLLWKKSETFRDITKAAFEAVADGAKWLMNQFFSLVANLLDKAADAVGFFLPALGEKLRSAADSVRDFRDDTNDAIDGIGKKSAKISIETHEAKKRIDELKKGLDDYAGTLDKVTFATTRATRAMLAERLEKSGLFEATRKLGFSDRDAIRAITGHGKLRDEMARKLANNTTLTKQQKDALVREGVAIQGSRIELAKAALAQARFAAKTAGSNKEVRQARTDIQNAKQKLQELRGEAKEGIKVKLEVAEAKAQARELKSFFDGLFGKPIKQGVVTGPSGGAGGLIPTGPPASPRPRTGGRVAGPTSQDRQLVQMFASSIESLLRPLDPRMPAFAYPAPEYAAPAPRSYAAPLSATPSGATGDLRLIDGELRLDSSGTAFISGVAMDADADDADYGDTLTRMGGV